MLYNVRFVKDEKNKNYYKELEKLEKEIFGSKLVFGSPYKSTSLYKKLICNDRGDGATVVFETDYSEQAFSSIVYGRTASNINLSITMITDDYTRLDKLSVNGDLSGYNGGMRQYLSNDYIKMTARMIRKNVYGDRAEKEMDAAVIWISSETIGSMINMLDNNDDFRPMNLDIPNLSDNMNIFIGKDKLFINYRCDDGRTISWEGKVEDLWTKASNKSIYNYLQKLLNGGSIVTKSNDDDEEDE